MTSAHVKTRLLLQHRCCLLLLLLALFLLLVLAQPQLLLLLLLLLLQLEQCRCRSCRRRGLQSTCSSAAPGCNCCCLRCQSTLRLAVPLLLLPHGAAAAAAS
jgi:hypothetical protein